MVSAKKSVPKNTKLKKTPGSPIIETKSRKSKPIKELVKKSAAENLTVKKVKSVIGQEEHKIKTKYVMPSKGVTEQIVKLSLKALQQLTTHYQKKNSILEDETPIFAEINCIKIQNSKGNLKFVLPHSTIASTGEVCLITPDLKKGRKIDHEPTTDHWEEILRNAGVTSVKTVLPMRQLRVEYDQFELKRRLLTQHDCIMVDTRILSHVSHVLGKMFFKKHNMLIPVRINEKTIKKDIDVGLRTAMLRLSEGATSTIIVGHTGMSPNHLKENILQLIQQLRDKFPGGEANIRSIAIKLPLSLSLPLFVTLRPSNSVITAPKLHKQKPKSFAIVEDELSTIPGSTVRVAPDGTVHLKKGPFPDLSDMDEDAEDEERGSGEEQLEKEE